MRTVRRRLLAGLRRLPPPVQGRVAVLNRARRPGPSFGPHLDLAHPGRASRSVVVACEARTGSSLLCDALGRTGELGLPDEYLNTGQISRAVDVFGVPVPTTRARVRAWADRLLLRRRWYAFDDFEPATFAPYLEEVVRRRTTPNGVFSMKIQWAQLDQARATFGFDPEALPQPVDWIHLERRDLVAQAVSFVRSVQTGAISKRTDEAAIFEKARYDDELLRSAYLRACRGVVKWNAFFRARGIRPIPVFYEDLADDYEAAIARVLSELGLTGVPVPPAELRRMADEVNRDWAARFRAGHPELVRSTIGRTQGPPPGRERPGRQVDTTPARKAAWRNQ